MKPTKEENKTKNPLVSVIIPTYKRDGSLIKAIESVINQTYKNLEIIIVDDNEKDSNEEKTVKNICESYSNSIKIVYHKTDGCVGGGRARNEGCAVATGEYFAFLDDDDIYLPEKIEKQLRFTIDNGYDMTFQDIIWRNEKEEIVEYRRFDYIRDFTNENLLKEHLMHNIAPTSIYFLSAEAFRGTKGFGDLKVGQDIYLMFDCINNGYKIGYLPGAYVNQYLHRGERISTGKKKIEGENWWYEEKQKYIHVLNRREKRFFKFRHYMILMFACIRSGYIVDVFRYGFIAFLTSPKDSIVEGYKYMSDKIKNKALNKT